MLPIPWLIAAFAGLIAAAWLFWHTPAAARLLLAANRRACGLYSRYVNAGGLRWHYLDGGHGEPLVLLHGFGGDADHWPHVARHLAAHCRVIAPDLPGWGDSAPPAEGDLSMEDQAERVFDLLDALGLERVDLGGSSMGGYIAVAMARSRPERVRSLWLLAPGGLREVHHSPLLAEVEAGRHNPLVVRDSADFDRLMAYCYAHPPPLPGPVRRLYVTRSIRRLDWQAAAFDALRNDSAPLEEMARDLSTPALCVWGDHDRVLNPDGLDSLAALMPNCRTVRVADAGHLPMLEHPRREAQRWLAFREVPGSL